MAVIDNDVTADVRDALPEEEMRICLFSISGDAFAIPVDALAEIIAPRKIFPIPATPPHILGIINLRGAIVPIIDIRPALSLPPQSVPRQVVVLKHGAMLLGIVVDNVSAVIPLREGSVRKSNGEQRSAAGGRSRFLKGIIQREAGAAALLDIDRLIDETRLA